MELLFCLTENEKLFEKFSHTKSTKEEKNTKKKIRGLCPLSYRKAHA